MKKRIIFSLFVSAITAVACSTAVSAESTPTMTIGAPSTDYAVNGDTIEYEVTYSDEAAAVNLTAGHIGLYGFTGDVDISGDGNSRTITISGIDIKPDFDDNGYGEIYITVNAGTAINDKGDLANGVRSETITVSDHPYMTMALRSDNADEGGSITVDITYRDSYNKVIKAMNLTDGHAGLYGFSGNVHTSIIDEHRAVVTVDNIIDKEGENYITINAGTACDEKGNLANGGKSAAFVINDTEAQVMTMSKPYASADGKSICIDLTYSDDDLLMIALDAGFVGLYGLKGDVSVSGDGNVRTVTVSDFTVTDDVMYITVNSGTAIDEDGSLANGRKSCGFTLGEDMKQAGEADDTNPATGVSETGTAGLMLLAAAVMIVFKKRK